MKSVKPGILAASMTVVAALVLSACGSNDGSDKAAATTETLQFTFSHNTAGEDEKPVYEDMTVEVPRNPENVVIFDMASLDAFGALGGEVDGAPLDSVPDYLEKYLADDAYNAGTLFEADLIEIEANQPDLIIIGGRSAPLYDDLSKIAPTVDLSATGSFEENLERNVTFFGEVLDAQDEAAAALEKLNAGIEQAREVTANLGTGLSVMVAGDRISALKPSNGDFSGRNLRGGLVYDVFGVEPVISNIEEATHGEPISFEFLLETNPDYLFVTDRNSATAEAGSAAAEVVLDNDIVKQTKAYKEGNIVYLDPTAWYIVFGGIDTTQMMIDEILSIDNGAQQ